MMRGVNVNDLADLAKLAAGINVLTGQGMDDQLVTEDLWVEVSDFVVKDTDGRRIGVFTFDHDTEDFVFVPRKTKNQHKP